MILTRPKSKFIRVKCKCNNSQIIFNKPASEVKCVKCGEVLARPSGGEADVKAKVLEVLE